MIWSRVIIRASGSNQDGHTPGITQPSGTVQEQLIKDTYTSGGLDLSTTRFIEAHGTGTPTGDPIEANAISAVFRDQRTQNQPLYIGAVKTNIGHLEGGSDMAALVKTVQVLENAIIPPNALLESVNPTIPVERYYIKVRDLERIALDPF